jgi:homoserine O-acetyltransferase/O-succinyltransferase
MNLFLHKDPITLENGTTLSQVEVAWQSFGHLLPDGSNVIWICHALTANSDVVQWWKGLIGPGMAIDTDKFYVICANVIGSCYGSTGPLSINPKNGQPYYHDFPFITIRDMVKIHDLLRLHLGIKKIQLLIGGSLGGQQALEWAIEQPDVTEQLVLIATNAKHSPWGIAFNEAQRMAIQVDPTWALNKQYAGADGLKAARAIALLSYRNYDAYHETQKEKTDEIYDQFRASGYQQYQGLKLVNRFNAFSYWILSKAMDSHNVGRKRGGVEHALNKVQARTQLIGISSDALFPIEEQQFIARHIPGSQIEIIPSRWGHDGFLVEIEKLSNILNQFIIKNK